MASLESLPADQRAVLQLVLQRGRSYGEIARLLSIDPSAVRQRAVSALDALGPQTGLASERRQTITDYLLGQLEPGAAATAQSEIAAVAGERAWARVVASELTPLASSALPEIPAAAAEPRPAPAASPPAASPPAAPPPAAPAPSAEPDPAAAKPGRQSIFPSKRRAQAARGAAPAPAAAKRERQSIFPSKRRAQASDAAPSDAAPNEEAPGRSSLFGGGVLIALTVIIVIAVVVLLLNSGDSSPTPAASASSSSTTTPAAPSAPTSATTGAPAAGTTTSGSSSAAKVVAQINLTPPSSTSKAAGIAEVLKEGTANGIAIVGQHVTPNTTTPPNAYAVWLYNSPTDAHILGFVNPSVGASGRLSTAGGLPSNAAHYKQLIVTVETKASPKTPGPIVLQGTLTGL